MDVTCHRLICLSWRNLNRPIKKNKINEEVCYLLLSSKKIKFPFLFNQINTSFSLLTLEKTVNNTFRTSTPYSFFFLNELNAIFMCLDFFDLIKNLYNAFMNSLLPTILFF